MPNPVIIYSIHSGILHVFGIGGRKKGPGHIGILDPALGTWLREVDPALGTWLREVDSNFLMTEDAEMEVSSTPDSTEVASKL